MSCPVLLQPMKEDPPLSVKCKDKFLVQSTAISPSKESIPLNELVRGRLTIPVTQLADLSSLVDTCSW